MAIQKNSSKEQLESTSEEAPDTHSHTLPDDGRSISRNVAEKHNDSRHDKLRNNMDTTESTNTNIFKINILVPPVR